VEESPGRQPLINSLRNPKVLAARKLLKRAERDRTGRLLVEGPAGVREALDAGAIVELFVDPAADRSAEVETEAARMGVPVHHVAAGVIMVLSDISTPQGPVAVATAPAAPIEILGESDLALLLAEVRDPGNAGTLIRSAAAAGADALVFCKGSVDPFNAKTVRASAGALFHVPLIGGPGLKEAVDRLRSAGVGILGADPRAHKAPDEVDMRGPTALVLGNESWGLREEAMGLLDDVVGIPMPGRAESLNVGIAGSILLFEAVRQRRRYPRLSHD
jgi:RNA methyltransferase, TrmH family